MKFKPEERLSTHTALRLRLVTLPAQNVSLSELF